jgi:hypothetical protein
MLSSIRLDQGSIDSLIGNSTEVMVYGAHLTRYLEIAEILNKNHGLRAYDCVNHELSKYVQADDKASNTRRKAKATIINLLIENNSRYRSGQPIIPLIFCIAIEENGCIEMVEYEQVAIQRNIFSSITDSELRRCYKACTLMGAEIKSIAEMTFKFVAVRQSQSIKDLYFLKQISPIWSNPNWASLWARRKQENRDELLELEKNTNKSDWRQILADNIALSKSK